VCQWLESLEIEIDQNRVADYQETFLTIAEHSQNGTLADLAKSVSFAKGADNFHDVSEVILIHQQLCEYDDPAFKRTLALAVKGPTLLAAERPQSSDARNRVSNWSWLLNSTPRISPLKFVEPSDSILTVDNAKCLVECKRIQTENALADRVHKASSQLRDRLDRETSAKPRGLIAIDISKTVNTDGTLYFSTSKVEYLTAWVDDRLGAFLRRNRATLTSQLEVWLLLSLVDCAPAMPFSHHRSTW
jgi:hypothetical protein